ncbi:Gfo/Idh/MocA family protein [Micromonospora eburnea]|uniref:Predicted dehydrogenase n=1 Tax=Micromonospora eburnea TaxID=227316 RepID=A0A1C6UI96_9ACTN|nr:Gfo/Idh/MocA family oxidoreductase [Micromonospora eburnea]SCL53790.1 Predicted dehydrogenase [Micromonospora eburnea]
MSRRIRAGVLSAGAWSESTHLPALANAEDVDLVVVSRPDGDRARELAERFGADGAETDWRAALTYDLDAVIVSSPPVAHEEMVTEALRSGAHVLCEKPFALEAGSARRMVTAARDNGRELLVAFGWSATPVFTRARALLERGGLGDVEHVAMHLVVATRELLHGSEDGGWGGSGGSQTATYTDPAVSAGGAAAVSMSHELGMLLWLLDRRVTEVTARTHPAGHRIDLHDSVLLTFEGEVTATVSCASTHPVTTRPEWYLGIQGSAADLWIDSALDRWRVRFADGTIDESRTAGDGAYSAQLPTQTLIDIAAGRLPAAPAGMSGDLAARVVEVTDAIYHSARVGGAVRLPEGKES